MNEPLDSQVTEHTPELMADPSRADRSPVGIYIRARQGERYAAVDLAHLSRASVLTWASGHSADYLSQVVLAVLGHPMSEDERARWVVEISAWFSRVGAMAVRVQPTSVESYARKGGFDFEWRITRGDRDDFGELAAGYARTLEEAQARGLRVAEVMSQS
jgi:hypothetical protein